MSYDTVTVTLKENWKLLGGAAGELFIVQSKNEPFELLFCDRTPLDTDNGVITTHWETKELPTRCYARAKDGDVKVVCARIVSGSYARE